MTIRENHPIFSVSIQMNYLIKHLITHIKQEFEYFQNVTDTLKTGVPNHWAATHYRAMAHSEPARESSWPLHIAQLVQAYFCPTTSGCILVPVSPTQSGHQAITVGNRCSKCSMIAWNPFKAYINRHITVSSLGGKNKTNKCWKVKLRNFRM